MTLLRKISNAIGCAAIALALPMYAGATGPVDAIVATDFASSGRVVNHVPDMSKADQALGRAAIWALTTQSHAPACADDDACFGTFQTGAQ